MVYELMVVVNPSENVEGLVTKVEKSIKDSESTNLKITKMGKKSLAYPIKRQNEGEFYLFNFETEGRGITGIASKLRLEQESVLRYLIIKSPKPFKISEVTKETKQEVQPKEEKEVRKVTVKTVVKSQEGTRGAKATKASKVAEKSKAAKVKKEKKAASKKTAKKK